MTTIQDWSEAPTGSLQSFCFLTVFFCMWQASDSHSNKLFGTNKISFIKQSCYVRVAEMKCHSTNLFRIVILTTTGKYSDKNVVSVLLLESSLSGLWFMYSQKFFLFLSFPVRSQPRPTFQNTWRVLHGPQTCKVQHASFWSSEY